MREPVGAQLGGGSSYRRDPLLYLVPLALTFAPFIWHASAVLGWPVRWLSTRVALVGCIALFAGYRIVSNDLSWRPLGGRCFVLPHLTLVTASVIWAALGVAAGDVAQLANDFVSWLLPVCVFFLLASSARSETDLAFVSRVLLVTMGAAASVALTQVLFFAGREELIPGPLAQLARQVSEETWFGSFRVYGTFPTIGPNMFGVFLIVPTAILLSRTAGASGSERWVWGLGAVVSVAMVGATLSRGAQLGLLVSLAMLPIWRRSWRAGMAVLGFTAVGTVVAAGTGVWQHALRLFAGGQLDVDALERLNIWRAILREAPERLLGFGFNGWARVSGRLVDVGVADGANTVGSSYPAENQWLRELADRGLLGVVALAVLIAGLLVVTYRASAAKTPSGWQRDFMAGAGAGFAGLAVAMLTGDHLSYESIAGMFWFVAAVVLSAEQPSDGRGPIPGSTALHVSPAHLNEQ